LANEAEVSDALRRRGGRPTKPANPGAKKVKLSLVVPAEIKIQLDAARLNGRSQSEEALRLIELGRVFERHGRFTLPPEMQSAAVELLVAREAGMRSLFRYLLTRDAPTGKEQYYRVQEMFSALGALVLDLGIRKPEENELDITAENERPRTPGEEAA
jgi:hypothetical protein